MATKLAFDRVLFTAVVLLTGVGLVMVYSASAAQVPADGGTGVNPFLVKQILAAALGFGLMLSVMYLDYRQLARPVVLYPLMLGVVALLVLVLFSGEINGSRRWFLLGAVSFQPSELAKVALVLYLAYQIASKEEDVHQPRLLVPCAVATGLLAGLVLLQPDLGTAALLVVVALLVLVLAGIPLRWVTLGSLMLLPVFLYLIRSEPYRWRRLSAFLHPELDPTGAGYQADQSLIAVGSGGLWGLGPGESVQKLHFLPHPHSDFVFAILAEELGLVGALAILALFAVLLWRGVRAGLHAPDTFGRFLGWGLTGLLGIQALVNVSVALALLPTKGIPLPFLSYGGSSLVVTLTACGLLLNVSQHGG